MIIELKHIKHNDLGTKTYKTIMIFKLKHIKQ